MSSFIDEWSALSNCPDFAMLSAPKIHLALPSIQIKHSTKGLKLAYPASTGLSIFLDTLVRGLTLYLGRPKDLCSQGKIDHTNYEICWIHRPDKMIGSVSLYSLKTQIISLARSCNQNPQSPSTGVRQTNKSTTLSFSGQHHILLSSPTLRRQLPVQILATKILFLAVSFYTRL